MIANGRKVVPSGGPVARNGHAAPVATALWGFGQDRPYDYVAAAVSSLRREGLAVRELPLSGGPHAWAREVASAVASGELTAAVVFCSVPCVAACVANKVPGVRAVSVSTVGQACLATLELAANLLVVEMPGRTFFEVKQFLRTIHNPGAACPDHVARTLQEMDGRAHR